MLAMGGVAYADTPQVVTLPTLVAGVSVDRDAWQHALDDKLEAGIKKSGRAPRLPGPLTSGELGCRDADCRARICEGNEGALVLGARVTADKGSPPSYKIVVVRYDREHPGTVQQQEDDCSVCTQADVIERLAHIVESMLPPPAVAVVAAPPEPPPVVVAPAPRRPNRHALLAGAVTNTALLTAGLVMLGVGGGALAINGTGTTKVIAPSTEAPRIYDTRAAGIGLLAAGSVVTVGTLIGLGFEMMALYRSKHQ
jgi:hypothetical protein